MKTLFPDDIFNLADIALSVARTDPDRLAVVEPNGRDLRGRRKYVKHTYRELSHDVESVAVGLRELGIAERTRTVFMAPPSYGACVTGLALTRVGATTVWIDPSVGYLNVAERLRRLEPEAFVGIPLAHLARTAFGWGPRFVGKAVVIGGPGFPGAHRWESLRRPPPAAPHAPDVRPDDTATIMYTTGSTGPAKPALYQHRNLCGIYRLVHKTWRFAETGGVPVDMPVFPAFFTIGLSARGTVVIPPIDYVREKPAKADPEALVDVINDCGVQTLFASPVILENIARLGEERGLTAPSLRTVIGGGAPLYAHVMRPLRKMMGEGGEMHADYGATEALPATEMPGREALLETFHSTARGAGLCVGRPFDGVEVKIVSIVDGPVATLADAHELPTGGIGEIVVRGEHVSPEYADDPASTKKNKISDGQGGVWHRLGDAGYVDDTGRVWCVGRLGHRVETAAGPMFPLMCEPIFDAHPQVRRTGLVGVPSGVGTMTPVICVELEASARDADKTEVRDQLLALAAQNPVTASIRTVLFHPRLPVDPRHNSKIERPTLAKWAATRVPFTSKVALAAAAVALVALVACGNSTGGIGDDDTQVDGATSGTDARPAYPDAGGGVDLGDPILVPPDQLEQWVWIPIPEMRCADDSPAGIGVNFTDQSRELVIWFQGNGVCYDLKSCTIFSNLMVGMGDDPINHLFWGDENVGRVGIFDRNDPNNPWRAANFVALPHCTVDGHAADKVSAYAPLPSYQQRGYRNATEALRRIAPTFVDAPRVTVAGFSAGAIGATANYHKIATTFEALGQDPPFLVADAGPLMRLPYLSQIADDSLRAGWGLADTFAWCPECLDNGPGYIYRALAERHPGMRASILSTYGDTVTFSLYRLLNYDLAIWDGGWLRRGLHDLDDSVMAFQPEVAPSAQRSFFYNGDRHGALVMAPLGETPGLLPFLQAQLAGDAAWQSVRN
ncbi:MAG TPA: fatty acid CoA ligase family protein [Kofleriaceae bacterium]|nr:fatty acid CoA ligase family protein [Kofleriaceae bacterium]